MANRHEAFGGRVVFHTRPTSILVSLDWQKLDRLIDGIEHAVKEAPNVVKSLVYCIASTEQIEFCFQGNETAHLTNFRIMWEGLRPYTVEGVTRALDWALRGALSIREEWEQGIESENALWIDPVDAPIEQLDPALQEAVTNSENPTSNAVPEGNRKISSGSTK